MSPFVEFVKQWFAVSAEVETASMMMFLEFIYISMAFLMR